DDLFTRQLVRQKVAFDPPAYTRQLGAELRELAELHPVAERAPLRVVSILLPAASVAAGRLQVPVGRTADPHVGPRRRNRERADTRQRGHVVHGRAVGVDVPERPPGAPPPQTGLLVDDVAQIGYGNERHGEPCTPTNRRRSRPVSRAQRLPTPSPGNNRSHGPDEAIHEEDGSEAIPQGREAR